MAQPPIPTNLQMQNYPSKYSDLLEPLLPVIQQQFDQNTACLNAGLTIDDNMNAQRLTVTVNTPSVLPTGSYVPNTATAWNEVGPSTGQPGNFSGGWQNVGTGLPNAAYRKDAAGNVWIRGVVKTGNTNPIFTLPSAYYPQIPDGSTGQNEFFFGSYATWTAITGNTPVILTVDANGGVNCYLVAPDGSATTNTGKLATLPGTICTQLNLTLMFPGVNAVPDSNNYISTVLGGPQNPYSCFPISNISIQISKPYSVIIENVVDTGTNPPPFCATGIAWVCNASGQLTINNIPGLAPGRQYQVYLRIEP